MAVVDAFGASGLPSLAAILFVVEISLWGTWNTTIDSIQRKVIMDIT